MDEREDAGAVERHAGTRQTGTRPNAEMVDFLNAGPTQPTNGTHKSNGFGMTERRSVDHEPSGWKARHTAAKPDPWIQMKFGVFLVLALSVWSFYVLVGRVCTPMIQRNSSTGLGRGAGIGLLIGFIPLWLMFMWTYLKLILTGPGFARNHVPQVPPPQAQSIPQQSDHAMVDNHAQPTQWTAPGGEDEGPEPSEFAPISNLITNHLQHTPSAVQSSSATLQVPPEEINPTKGCKKDWKTIVRPVPRVTIGPRWCRFCQINKPDRTHHCRHCGTCVMQFDHHCLWLGECVGWANHKFFLLFTFWAMIYCLYILGITAAYAALDSGVDGQVVGLLAVSALFGLFTGMMWGSHIYLICMGKSTVESYAERDQHEMEASVLQAEFGYLWHNQAKKKTQKRWEEEWGGESVDGRWRWGNKMQMWRQEMGDTVLGWIVPIGRPQGDGLVFRSNPHFGPNGEWLQKKDWPSGS